MQELSNAFAWQESLELSKRLVRICEEFSDANTNVLVWHLRQAVVDVPAGVAADLQANRDASMEAVVKLGTALELVRKIYPAIETADADQQLEWLVGRMKSTGFHERQPEPEPVVDEAPSIEPQPAPVNATVNPPSGPPQPAPVDVVPPTPTMAVTAAPIAVAAAPAPQVDGLGAAPSSTGITVDAAGIVHQEA